MKHAILVLVAVGCWAGSLSAQTEEPIEVALPARPPLPDATIINLPPEPAAPDLTLPTPELAPAKSDGAPRDSAFEITVPPVPDEGLLDVTGDVTLPLSQLPAAPVSAELSDNELRSSAPALPLAEPAAEEVPKPPAYVPSQFPLGPPEARPDAPGIVEESTTAESQADFRTPAAPASPQRVVPVAPRELPIEPAAAAGSGGQWISLSLAILGLLASLGGNVYLGLLLAGLYRKHRILLDDSPAGPAFDRPSPAQQSDAR